MILSPKNRIKILIANDSRLEVRILKDMMKVYFKGREKVCISSCSRGDDALECIKNASPDLVFLDWIMPGIEGPDICKTVRSFPEIEERHYCYIIMTTSSGDRNSVTKGLASGADDFLTKPFFFEDINVRTSVAMRLIGAYKKLLFQKEALEKISRIDMLTGMLNRRFVIQYLKNIFLDTEKNVSELSLCLCDVDFFKHVNDEYGHLAGDFVLRRLGSFFNSFFASWGVVGRYGGDEFLFVLPGVDFNSSRLLLKKFYEELQAYQFIFEGNPIEVSLSCGLVSCGSLTKKSESFSDYLIKKADDALYRSKKEGRGRVSMDAFNDI